MKTAVVTAIFGDMEKQKPFPAQTGVDCDYFCFNPENSPFPLPNLPPRLQAKYFKLQTHRVLPGYDCYIWIDGNIEVTSPDFVKKMTAGLDGIRIQKHHERQTIGEEIAHILASENPYVTTRYGAQPLKQEYEWYLAQGMPEDAPLYSCNIFAWANDSNEDDFRRLNADIFDEWWELVLLWSWFDQSAFSFLAWKYNSNFIPPIMAVDLGPMLKNDNFILHPHDNWNQ